MTAAPPPKRGLSAEEAAAYCGVSEQTLLRHGAPSIPLGRRRIYDRVALDRWLDRLSGIADSAGGAGAATVDLPSPLQQAIHARNSALRHTPRR